MWSRMLVAAGLAAGLVTSIAHAEDGYRHGRVFFVEPGVTLQRATEVSAEEALRQPALPARRPRVDGLGRAGGVPVPRRHARAPRPPQQARLLRARGRPGRERGAPAVVGQRVPARAGASRRALRGRDAGRHGPGARSRDAPRRRRLRRDPGERLRRRGDPRRRPEPHAPGRGRAHVRALGRPGRGASSLRAEPRRTTSSPSGTGRARPRSARPPARPSTCPTSSTRTPASSSATDSGGTRTRSATSGPRASRSAGSPTRNGHWAWTPYGYTWVPYERWGWAPSHYGRWGMSASFGWYWVPGRTWGPAWVSWAVGGGYVGWCPLGWRDQPVRPWGYHRGVGYAASRGRYGQDPWSVVRHDDLRGRDVARRRVGFDRVDAGALRVADSTRLAAHPRRAEPPGGRCCPARHQPPPDAGRLRARAGRRQQDDDPGAVDSRLRPRAGGSGRGAAPGRGAVPTPTTTRTRGRTRRLRPQAADWKGAPPRRGSPGARRLRPRLGRRRTRRVRARRRPSRRLRPEPRAEGPARSGAP